MAGNPAQRILIADDDSDIIEALRLLLKSEGYQIEAVKSPAAAVKAVEEKLAAATKAADAAVASFGGWLLAAGLMDPVVFGAAALGSAAAAFGVPLAMLLAGLEGIGPATLVQVSPPQRNPSTQPLISSWSEPIGLMVEL